MKRIILTVLAFSLPAILFAMPFSPWASMPTEMFPREAGLYVKAEISQIQTEYGADKLGAMSLGDWMTIRDRLSVASEKDRYVDRMATASFFLPGLGQFQEGDTGSGIGFLALDIGVIAGTLVAAYYLLPSDLRFDRLDYFGDSVGTVNDAWESHSLTDYLPAIGALCGGIVIDQIVRHFASAHARRGAIQAVDQEKVKFTPQIGIGVMGFNIKY